MSVGEIAINTPKAKQKICVFTVTCQKNLGSVGRHWIFFPPYYQQNRKCRSGIRFRYFIFEISGKPSFVEAVLWRVMQFFYLLCSQFRQKTSSWINKTLLLINQQKWLSEFCVKINKGVRLPIVQFVDDARALINDGHFWSLHHFKPVFVNI
jgi:hypothetical protein